MSSAAQRRTQPGDPAERLLAEVAARLRGPRGRRADLLIELRDGLQDATEAAVEAAVRAGSEPAAAADLATVEFGDSSLLAAELQEELACHQARRTGWLVAVLAPGLELAWSLLYPRLAAPVVAQHPEITAHPWFPPAHIVVIMLLAAGAVLCLAGLGSRRFSRHASRAAGLIAATTVTIVSSSSAIMTVHDRGITMIALSRSPAGLALATASALGLVVMSVAAIRALRSTARTVLNVSSSMSSRCM